MKKSKNDFYTSEWGKQLIDLIGGIENVKSLSHCLTRLRFMLKDLDKTNQEELLKLDHVKGVFHKSGLFQIVIGTEVNYAYDGIMREYKIEGMSKEEMKQEAQKGGSKFLAAINYMGEIFVPLIPILVAGGIILGIRNIFEANFNGWSMVGSSQFMAGLNDFLWIPAQACFWWLPVHICWSMFRKMKADEALGIVIGLTMLIPPLVNTYETIGGAAGTDSTWIWDIVNSDTGKLSFNFGFMKYPWKIQYTAQVIPALMVGWIGAKINLWIKRVTPGYLYQIQVPLVTLLPTFVIAMFVIGPLGFIIGSGISFGFKWAFTNFIAKYFFGAIIGFTYAPIVVTGVHHMFNAIFIQNTIQNGGNFLFIATCVQSIAQGSAVLGWMIMNKKDPKVKDVGVPSVVSAYLGVTEPAMYGINIKYMYPFIAACIGSAIGTEFAVIAGVSAFNSGNGAWLGILNVQSQSEIAGVTTWIGTGYLWFMITMIIVVASTILFTILLSKVKYFKKFDLNFAATDSLFKKDEAKKEKKVALSK